MNNPMAYCSEFWRLHALGQLFRFPRIPDPRLMIGAAENLESVKEITYPTEDPWSHLSQPSAANDIDKTGYKFDGSVVSDVDFYSNADFYMGQEVGADDAVQY